jgi:dihydroxynaphthoic acid synthetase
MDVLYDVDNGVAWARLNRPEKLNALRFETVGELTEALRRAEADRSVGVIVITGMGKAFSVGGDLAVLAALEGEEIPRWHRGLNELGLLMRRLGKPIVAAVNGYCIGGGNELNLFCDLTIASEQARFGQAGPRVGSTPVWGATQLLPRLVGYKRAREIIFLCRQYTAAEALEMGWINRVVPHDELYPEVRRWADEMLRMSPAALRTAKRAWAHDESQLAASLEYGAELLTELWTSDEGKEGMQAFLAKRQPDFSRFR